MTKTNSKDKPLFARTTSTPIGRKLLGNFFFFLCFSCTPDPPPPLSYQDRQLVDSLYRMQVDSLKPLLDSLCNARFDSAVQMAVDSIVQERLSEKEKYLQRLKKELGN